MSIVQVSTNFNIDIEFQSPPFHKRLFAWVFDIVVQIFYIVIALKLYSYISNWIGFGRSSGYTMWAIGLVLVLPFLLYHLIFEITMNGQSIGKTIMGIKVISETGGKPSISQYIIRWLIRTSDYTIFILIIMIPYAEIYGPIIYWGMAGAIVLLFIDVVLVNSNKQQRLGDILAHTLIISTRQNEKIEDTVFLDISTDYVPTFHQVMQLSDGDVNSLKRILDTAKKHKDFELAANASEKIKAHLKIVTPLAPIEFLEILLKDYNYLSVH